LEGSLVTPDIDSVIWSWSFGNGQTSDQQNPGVIFISSGQFTISLRTSVSFGCADTTSKTVTVNPLPSIKGPAEIVTPVGFPVTIPFTYSTNTVTYSWTPVTNLSCTDCPNPVAADTFSTLYKVMVTDSNHCVSYDSIFIKTICDEKNYFIPNTFSPNGDGVNDVFYPRGRSLYNIQSMRVFNRWGQKVFEKRNFPANTQSEGWDGTFNGRPAAVDAYVYIIEVICENAQIISLKGDVTLIR
jgi:gliding motility-associated-like protein